MRMLGHAEMRAEVPGLSFRQLDYWTRKGYLTSVDGGRGSGSQRHWSEQERDVARVMLRLMKAMGSTATAAGYVARVLVTLNVESVALDRGMFVHVDLPPGGYARDVEPGAPGSTAAAVPGTPGAKQAQEVGPGEQS